MCWNKVLHIIQAPDSKEILLPKGHLVTLEDSDKINKMGVESIKARSTITLA
jgi:DNA-directed RNA polymerase subunit beta'